MKNAFNPFTGNLQKLSDAISDITGLQTALDAKVAKAGDTMTGDLYNTSATVAAAGTTQGTATALTKQFNFVTSGTGGVKLPTPANGGLIYFIDNDIASELSIYPASGGKFDGGTVDAPKKLAAGKVIAFVSETTTEWLTIYGSGAYIPSGATLPTTGITDGQLFTHTPPGRSVWMKYNSSTSAWVPILNEGTTTMYVDGTNGTDSQNNGYGTGTNAFKTIQYSQDQIGGLFSGNIGTYVAAGTLYEKVTCQGKTPTGNYYNRIYGNASITTSGTATSGATQVLNDTGKAWTVNVYKGKKLKITGGTGSGQEKLIQSNTATQLTIVGAWNTTPDSTSTYEVYDRNTVVSGASAAAPTTKIRTSAFSVYNIYTEIHDMIVEYTTIAGVEFYFTSNFSRVKNVEARYCTHGIYQRNSANIARLVYSHDNTSRGIFSHQNSVLYYAELFAENNGGAGIEAHNSQILCPSSVPDGELAGRFLSKGNGSHGFHMTVIGVGVVAAGECVNNGGWGAYASEKSLGQAFSGVTYSGNVSGTYGADASSTIS